jgi:phosphonoacetaldehyde hydrolase
VAKCVPIDETLVQTLYIDFELEMFRTIPSCSNVIPGVTEVMQYLRGRNIKVGSTTGYTKKMLDLLSGIAKEQGYEPDARVAADEVQKVILKWLQRDTD